MNADKACACATIAQELRNSQRKFTMCSDDVPMLPPGTHPSAVMLNIPGAAIPQPEAAVTTTAPGARGGRKKKENSGGESGANGKENGGGKRRGSGKGAEQEGGAAAAKPAKRNGEWKQRVCAALRLLLSAGTADCSWNVLVSTVPVFWGPCRDHKAQLLNGQQGDMAAHWCWDLQSIATGWFKMCVKCTICRLCSPAAHSAASSTTAR